MFNYKKIIKLKLTLIFILFASTSFADNHNLKEIIELIQKDIKTLEKAIYSKSINMESFNNKNTLGKIQKMFLQDTY